MDFGLSCLTGKKLARIDRTDINIPKYIYLRDLSIKCCDKCKNIICNGRCCDKCLGIDIWKNTENNQHLQITKGILNQVPVDEKHQVDVKYFVGRQGAGKSYEITKFIKEYKMVYPNRKVFIISEKESDENFENMNVTQLNIFKFFGSDVEEKTTFETFKIPCLVIFDDVDCLKHRDKELKRDVFTLISTIINLCRDHEISVIQTSHIGTDGNETRDIIGSMNAFTYFKHAKTAQIDRILMHYMGIDKQLIKQLKNVRNTRPITVFRTCPTVIMYDKGIFIPNDKIKL